jgi:hypothetical protein
MSLSCHRPFLRHVALVILQLGTALVAGRQLRAESILEGAYDRGNAFAGYP